MKNNGLTQLREVIEALLIRQANLHKPFRNFIIETMILYIVMLGKENYTSMARISDSCESRFRQNFKQPLDWLGFNMQFTERIVDQRKAIAIDTTHISQARNEQALGFSYNMSLSSINVMRKYARKYGYTKLSIGSLKLLMHNAYMLNRFISISGKSPKQRKNDTDFKELLFLGVRDAA